MVSCTAPSRFTPDDFIGVHPVRAVNLRFVCLFLMSEPIWLSYQIKTKNHNHGYIVFN